MTFLDFMKDNKDKAVFVDPCEGNNGDDLIWLGMQEVLSLAQSRLIKKPNDAEIIVINGGGMFIDAYTQGIKKIEYYSKHFPNTLLVIAPNSFHFKTVDFSFYLDLRQSPMILFSREKYSKAYIDNLIKDKQLIQSEIDNDLALNLKNSEFIANLKQEHYDQGHVLVVDRMDIENSKASRSISVIKTIYRLFVPEKLKNIIRRHRVQTRASNGTDLTKRALADLKIRKPELQFKTILTKDISRKDVATFQEFCSEISRAEVIYTNRLHVGVLAHLLNKEVYLIEGSYHKLTGIYELSMSHKNTTTLLKDF